jgi:cyanophycinase
MNWLLKKKFFQLFVLTINLLAFTLPAHATKIFLVGGALEDDNYSIYNALLNATHKNWKYNPASKENCSVDWDTTPCPRIAVVVSGSDNLASGIDIFNGSTSTIFKGFSYYNLFQRWGFSPKLVQIAIDNYATASVAGNPVGDANIAIVKQADVVFFNGGDQSRHSRAWINKNGSDSPILAILRTRVNQDSVIVAGTSAGTAVQGHYTYGEGNSYGYLTINDLAAKSVDSQTGLLDDRAGDSGFKFDNNGGKMLGFGFLSRNIAFDTHFDQRGRLGRMIVAMKSLEASDAVGVDENTALYIQDDVGTVYGANGVFIADSTAAQFSATSQRMNVTGVRMNILTDGDSYNFKTKIVSSSKAPIERAYVLGSKSSNNIFGSYVSTKLMTHLTIQTGDVNHGYSDKDRPGFEYRFSKDNKTSGHYSMGQYTVKNVIMDILNF